MADDSLNNHVKLQEVPRSVDRRTFFMLQRRDRRRCGDCRTSAQERKARSIGTPAGPRGATAISGSRRREATVNGQFRGEGAHIVLCRSPAIAPDPEHKLLAINVRHRLRHAESSGKQ